MNKYLASSVDPEKLSLTIKGILGGIATVVVLVATTFGVNVTQGELQIIIDNVGDLIVGIGAVISTIVFIWGAVRKIVVKFRKVSPTE